MEQELVSTLFFQNISERQVYQETGISQETIHNRKVCILSQLKNLLKIKNNLAQQHLKIGLVVIKYYTEK